MTQGWTIETLKEHFEKILAEKDKALVAALVSAKEAVTVALSSAKEAVAVAEKNAEKWRDSANEWRSAMNDKDKLLMTRSEFVSYKEATEKALQAEKSRGDRGEGKSEGYAKFIGWIIAGITIIGFILTQMNNK
jgi:hypothetical protein